MKRTIAPLLLLLYFVTLQSRAETLYWVECIIFKFTHPNPTLWQAPQPLDFSRTFDLTSAPESAPPQAFQLAPSSSFKLANEASRLRADSHYKVLLHQAWVQPLVDSPEAKAIHIFGGSTYQSKLAPPHQIEGSITISQNTYLNIRTNLFLTEENPHSSATDLMMYHFEQTRRSRSNELNYIDSPQMGVLIKVSPILSS